MSAVYDQETDQYAQEQMQHWPAYTPFFDLDEEVDHAQW